MASGIRRTRPAQPPTRAVGVHVLAKPDIVEYLPAGLLVPGATSWGHLVADWRKARASCDQRAFKLWLREERGADLSEPSLRKAAGTLDDLQDLGIVASLVAGLSRRARQPD